LEYITGILSGAGFDSPVKAVKKSGLSSFLQGYPGISLDIKKGRRQYGQVITGEYGGKSGNGIPVNPFIR